ncbi:TPA: hypothetical protein DE059_00155 [Candidatus Peribacteria bacterium]|nr:hypothetical protein [Candidatus Peribacteria bacterium]
MRDAGDAPSILLLTEKILRICFRRSRVLMRLLSYWPGGRGKGGCDAFADQPPDLLLLTENMQVDQDTFDAIF